MELFKAVEESFSKYAGETIYNRALVDVRDGLKPSARIGLYAQYIDKITSNNPYKKSIKSVSSAMNHFYVHGDAAMYNLLMRMGKPFASRYLLEDVQGAVGNLNEPENHAASRYTEMRLSKLGTQLFSAIEKATIDKWYLNYSGDEKFPEVLPSLGFWSLCNGAMGIASGLSCSIPQFNLREMNEALIAMLEEREYTLPLPDFATGGLLLNSNEVRESLLKGQGASCRLRAKIEYDEKTRTFTVVEVPYATYTNTICKELEELLLEDNGIDMFLDVTGMAPNIQIKLTKNADPSAVLQLLYAKTSLQNTYGINLTMLENGRYPKVFTLPEAMQAHIDHEIEVYTRAFTYDLNQICARIHILDGYILACAHIEEVIEVIKKSGSREDAKANLIASFSLDSIQADAVLKLTLSRIASLEVEKFIREKEASLLEKARLEEILNSEALLKKEVITGLRSVMSKFGDARRTQLLNVAEDIEDKVYFFTADGKVGLSSGADTIGTLPLNQPYFCVTYQGIVYRSEEQPKRKKQVFKLNEGDRILKVYPYDENMYLTLIDEEKRFRCKEVGSLNKIKTTLSLTNLKEAHLTKERTTKTNYKEIINNQ